LQARQIVNITDGLSGHSGMVPLQADTGNLHSGCAHHDVARRTGA
jgi:hypothetical protein